MVQQRFLCPVIVSRDAELSALEDALVAANRGEPRFVLVEGEAGIGKSRLAAESTVGARKIGYTVLSGGCTDADVSLPYLPFLEALGNYISMQDAAELGAKLGPARAPLAQLFPQLSDGVATQEPADPLQVKTRLFEAVIALLGIAASSSGVLLILEDLHWADAATRELLDHLARRTAGMRIVVLMTYRSDEIDRRHPLLPLLQSWRRSGIGETIRLSPLGPAAAAAMIGAILDEQNVGEEFRDLLLQRSEGNPFVLEEMLKETVDRGDVFKTDAGWDRRSLEDIRIPDTVKDTILLRVGRFDQTCIEVLQAAAVLGRVFDYPTLVEVSGAQENVVQRALEVATAQQLIDEQAAGAYQWRHALTQEAIGDDTVSPRRQMLHSRAADWLAKNDAPAVDVAYHLLGAGRVVEAVPVCLEAAEQAEASLAYPQAIELYERALPHVGSEVERARILCRMGMDWWMYSSPARAEPHFVEGIALLETHGLMDEVGRALVTLGRCRWELNRTPEARADYERAREILEGFGPSADLAFAYVRIAGLHAFECEYAECLSASRLAIDIAEQVGADRERIWGRAFLALGLFDLGEVDEGVRTMQMCFTEAMDRGFYTLASNVVYNDVWTRVHLMLGGLDEAIERAKLLPKTEQFIGSLVICRSNARLAKGDLPGALEDGKAAADIMARLGFAKFLWRCQILEAESLYEMGRYDEAWRALPSDGGSLDLQDVAYESAVQLRLRLATGETDEAVVIARRILARADKLVAFRESLSLAAETFVAAGLLDEAEQVLLPVRERRSDAGMAFLDLADARIALARGDIATAKARATAAAERSASAGFTLVELRARAVLAEAVATEGRAEATGLYDPLVQEAIACGALTIADEARAVAERHGIDVAVAQPVEARPAPSVPVGERLITSVFADVRNYTQMTADTPAPEMASRIATLYRWAATEVERNHGVVNRFAGDAVMATFNVDGTQLDHCVDALRAAMALRDKAALADLPIGIGLAVGPAVVGTVVEGQDMMVTGVATNLAARLQTAAAAGEILLSEEAFRRASAWLTERSIAAQRELLELKGFEGAQVAYRIRP